MVKIRAKKITNIQIFDALGTREVQEAKAGEIVILSGIDNGMIGDTITSKEDIKALERIDIDPPTVSVTVSVNTSPGSGREGEYLTSRKLEEFLENACRHNVALQFSPTDDPKEFELKGRGELQLAIVFEEVRRAGFELMVAKAQVLFKEVEGKRQEPFESVVLDVPNEDVGTVTETLSERKGKMVGLNPLGRQGQGLSSKFLPEA